MKVSSDGDERRQTVAQEAELKVLRSSFGEGRMERIRKEQILVWTGETVRRRMLRQEEDTREVMRQMICYLDTKGTLHMDWCCYGYCSSQHDSSHSFHQNKSNLLNS